MYGIQSVYWIWHLALESCHLIVTIVLGGTTLLILILQIEKRNQSVVSDLPVHIVNTANFEYLM